MIHVSAKASHYNKEALSYDALENFYVTTL